MVDTAAHAATPEPNGQSPAQALYDRRAPQREQLLEGLRAVREARDPSPSSDTTGASAAAAAPVVPEATAPPAAPEAAPAAAETLAPADPAPAPAAEAEPAPEPPGMAAVRKAEQHARRQLAQERAAMLADFDSQKAAWQAKIDKAAEIESRITNARQDPLAAMTALGFSESDYEAVGRLLYAHSPEGQKDPRHKAAAAQTLAQREQQAVLDKLQRELAEMKEGLTVRERAAEQQARADRYINSVTKAVSDETPLAKAAYAKNPERTKAALFDIALRLYAESGPSDDLRDEPTPAEVLRAYDAQRAAELEELGFDPKTLGRPAAAPAPTTTPAPPARPAATLAPAGAGAPVAPKTNEPPSRDEVLAGLAKMRGGG